MGYGLLNHGKGPDGTFLGGCWDRLNGEAIFMYVLAAGAAGDRALASEAWSAFLPFCGTVAGLRFKNADLGLFTFGYGLEMLDIARWLPPDGTDLLAEARLGTRANHMFCREHADQFSTYRHFWGLSDGDGPGTGGESDSYRAYGPVLPLDGTAHLSAAAAAVAYLPEEVSEQLERSEKFTGLTLRGKYGFASVNLDRKWVGGDMVGIDAGALALALDNYLVGDRVRHHFHELPCVALGLKRAGFQTRRKKS